MSIANPLSNPDQELDSGKVLSKLGRNPGGTTPTLGPSRGLGAEKPLSNPDQELDSGKVLSKLSRCPGGANPLSTPGWDPRSANPLTSLSQGLEPFSCIWEKGT